MFDALPVPVRAGALVSLADEDQAVRDFQLAEKSPTTRNAYARDMRQFVTWCEARGLPPLPASPGTVAKHLAWASRFGGLSPSSIGRRTSAIAYAHELAGLESPTRAKEVKMTAAGIRRETLHVSQKKAAATDDVVRELLATCTDGMIGFRDRALLGLGFAGAFRRSELVALQVSDLTEVPDGYRVCIRRSKTDQEGKGQEIVVPRGARIRPVEAVQTWLAAAGIEDGPLFRRLHRYGAVRSSGLTPHMIALIVKKRCALAGVSPDVYSGHSLRSGFLTSAAEAGASVFKMMEVSRHRSVDVLAGYIRRGNLFRDHAGASFL